MAPAIPAVVPVRDSKTAPDGPVLTVSRAAWAAFTSSYRRHR
ncbi:DUF397 domain-containing protein [Streptomyces sp. TRM68367]|nr:DUF397 domain-containing protein [Streptomyces sp. TRM68367]